MLMRPARSDVTHLPEPLNLAANIPNPPPRKFARDPQNPKPMTAGHPVELQPLFGDYPLDQAFDEMREPGGEVRAQYRALAETLAALPADELRRRKQSVDLALPHSGHHLHRLRPRRGHRTHLPLRSAAPPGHCPGVGPHRARAYAAHHRHIRTAVGRDYADVPPTHGVLRGKTASELYVAVKVEASEQSPTLDRKLPIPEDWSVLVERAQQPPELPVPFIDLPQMQQQQ